MLQWDALDETEKAKYPFQHDLKRRMDGIIADCMKKIDRNKERLAAADTPLVTLADQVRPHPRLHIQARIKSACTIAIRASVTSGSVMLESAPEWCVSSVHGLAAGPQSCSYQAGGWLRVNVLFS